MYANPLSEQLCIGCFEYKPRILFEKDHIIPKSRGGSDELYNIQLLCSLCNRKKGNRSMNYLWANQHEGKSQTPFLDYYLSSTMIR